MAANIDIDVVADVGAALHVELHTSDARCRLTLEGHLNATNLAVLEAHVDFLGHLPCHDVVVDLGLLTGLDRVGANVLLGLYYYVVARGGAFRVIGAGEAISVLLLSLGDEMLPLEREACTRRG